MISKKTILCTGDKIQNHQANIILAFGKNTIFVRCNDKFCKRWLRIRVNIPGINLNFHKAGFTQELLPKEYHLHLEQATTVVSEYQKDE
jgi:hypothetical protein